MDRTQVIRDRLDKIECGNELDCSYMEFVADARWLLDTLTRERADRWVKQQEYDAVIENLRKERRDEIDQWNSIAGDQAGRY
jgi:hypothetical protein